MCGRYCAIYLIATGNVPLGKHVAQQFDAAARGHDVTDAAIALRLALMLDRVECQPA